MPLVSNCNSLGQNHRNSCHAEVTTQGYRTWHPGNGTGQIGNTLVMAKEQKEKIFSAEWKTEAWGSIFNNEENFLDGF